jgi:hypothetical protein
LNALLALEILIAVVRAAVAKPLLGPLLLVIGISIVRTSVAYAVLIGRRKVATGATIFSIVIHTSVPLRMVASLRSRLLLHLGASIIVENARLYRKVVAIFARFGTIVEIVLLVAGVREVVAVMVALACRVEDPSAARNMDDITTSESGNIRAVTWTRRECTGAGLVRVVVAVGEGLSVARVIGRRVAAVLTHVVGGESVSVVGEMVATEVLDRSVLLVCTQVSANSVVAACFAALDGSSVSLEDIPATLEIAAVEGLDNSLGAIWTRTIEENLSSSLRISSGARYDPSRSPWVPV